jgi:chitodextrinase
MKMEEERGKRIEGKKKSVTVIVLGASLVCCCVALLTAPLSAGAGAGGALTLSTLQAPTIPVSMPLHEYREAGSEVVINEFMAQPIVGSDWIELYNPTASTVSLDQWTITDGAANAIDLTGEVIMAHGYLVLEFSNKLNNAGDVIYLHNPTETVDTVAYGTWDDGNTADNAPAPEAGQSVGRYTDGWDTDNDSADFRFFTSPTPGAPNTIVPEFVSATPPSPVYDDEGATRTFTVTVNQTVNITWLLNGTVVQLNVSVPAFACCSYTSSSAIPGYWNLSAVTSNANGSVCHTWWWTVTEYHEEPESATVHIDDAHANQGESTVSLITIHNATNLGSIDLEVTYNHSVVLVTNASAGDFDETVINLEGNATGFVKIVAFQAENPGLNGTVVLAGLELTAVGGLRACSPLNLSVKKMTDATPECADLPCTVRNGTFSTNRPPVADAGPDRTVLLNDTVCFNASGSYDPDGALIAFFWDFGDGSNATGVNVTHRYNQNGMFVVHVTVTDNDGATGSDTCTITVNAPPVADAGPDHVCLVGDEVYINGSGSYDPDGVLLTYQWNFGDGVNATGPAVTHSYADAGTYTVTLTVTDNLGSLDVATCTVTVFLNGDVNGNGECEISDAMYLARHLADIAGFESVEEIVCDVNGNGLVEISDALYLARHLAHISGFEELR